MTFRLLNFRVNVIYNVNYKPGRFSENPDPKNDLNVT